MHVYPSFKTLEKWNINLSDEQTSANRWKWSLGLSLLMNLSVLKKSIFFPLLLSFPAQSLECWPILSITAFTVFYRTVWKYLESDAIEARQDFRDISQTTSDNESKSEGWRRVLLLLNWEITSTETSCHFCPWVYLSSHKTMFWNSEVHFRPAGER